MACISAPVIGGAISGIGSLGSGLFGASAATSAAKSQAAAAEQATALAAQIYQQNTARLQPFVDTGSSLFQQLASQLTTPGSTLSAPLQLTPPTAPALTSGFSPTMATLQTTPGYQFTLQQGQKAVQNQLAAQGLGSGGAAGVGAAQYAEGLAGTTFQNQFSNWLNTQNLAQTQYGSQLASWLDSQNLSLNQKQLLYNMLSGGSQLGEAAAAQTASAGVQSGGQIGSYLTAGGAAQAAGTIGSANALTGGISGASNAALSTAALLALTGSGGGGGFSTTDYGSQFYNPATGAFSGGGQPVGTA